jgi:IMP dehydrogenase
MGKILTGEYLTFDDVLIYPGASAIEPKQATVSTVLAKGFTLDIPIISAAMDRVSDASMAVALSSLGGLAIIHRNNTAEEEAAMVKEAKKKGARVGAACGPFDIERAKLLVKAGADLISIDSAHGHNANVIAGAKKIKKVIGKVPLLVGNIATKEAAEELVTFADGIKVGIGPGSICTTRIVSGVGVPQLSAIMDVAAVASKKGIPVIADGGIRNSGDIAKAIAAGASAVMLGGLLAATDAAPGKVITMNGKKFKEYRGMGSMAVLKEKNANDRYLGDAKGMVAEGVSGLVPYAGTLEAVVGQLVGGLKVSMGYVGAKDLKAHRARTKFIKVSKAAVVEGRPHSLAGTKDDAGE